jgi:hypothetical protein
LDRNCRNRERENQINPLGFSRAQSDEYEPEQKGALGVKLIFGEKYSGVAKIGRVLTCAITDDSTGVCKSDISRFLTT